MEAEQIKKSNVSLFELQLKQWKKLWYDVA